MKKTSALVLFSGGQDSTVCLAWALENFNHVETIGFHYNQRHVVELDCRQDILKQFRDKFTKLDSKLGADHVLKLEELGQISDTSLTREAEIEMSAVGLPNTFVPGRNLLFFTYAAAVAYRRHLDVLVGGMCETDYSGYPDCRNETLTTLSRAISLGMDRECYIETPLMYVNKQDTWQLAYEIGGDDLVEIIIKYSHTCYLGDRQNYHEWGFGCGHCPACQLRLNGYLSWKKSQSV